MIKDKPMDWNTSTPMSISHHRYCYSYDGLNRLDSAKFMLYYPGLEIMQTNQENFSTSYSYDLNSNLTSLRRYGKSEMYNVDDTEYYVYGLIDDLSITRDGNQLKKVTDQCEDLTFAGAMEFKDGADQPVEYTWDANGNTTSDKNKRIHEIRYNVLNLPERIYHSDGHVTYITYAADGRKLRVSYRLDLLAAFEEPDYPAEPEEPTEPDEPADPGEPTGGPLGLDPLSPRGLGDVGLLMIDETNSQTEQVLMTRDYCGSYTYRNGALERIMMGNGFLQDSAYYVQLKDYQGNVRAVLDHNATLVERNQYYPYGGLINPPAIASTLQIQPYKYSSKELDRENGLDLYDSQARWYDPMLPQTTIQDPLAEKYYSISPYTWCAGNTVNAKDIDGKLIIFINGFNNGDGGKSKYWEGVDKHFMTRMNDFHTRYYDGSLGGAKGLFSGSKDVNNRVLEGFKMGLSHAEIILSSLKNGEKIRFVTHSMGAAYAKGFIKGLQSYARDNNINIKDLIQLEVDLAPYQPDKQSANEAVRTIVIAHKQDNVAGSKPMSGAENHVTRKNESRWNIKSEHSVNSFTKDEIYQYVPVGNISEGGINKQW